jgi:hypothetical protein
MNDGSNTLGYCLEGKLGQTVRMGFDTTTEESSCDAHAMGNETDRAEVARQWAESLLRT